VGHVSVLHHCPAGAPAAARNLGWVGFVCRLV
jgi:hypothetical protein